MENSKPYTLISSPRSGSTLIYFIVRWYLIKKYNYRNEHLGEYFNPYHYNLLYRDVFSNGEKVYKENIPIHMQKEILKIKPGVEIINNHTIKAPPHKEIFCISEQNIIKKMYDYNNLENVDEETETQHRIALLEHDFAGKYFFKNHADPLPESAFTYILPKYYFICVDRINKLDQYLSFAIANHTRIWMTREDKAPVIEKNSLVFRKEIFDQLTKRMLSYDQRCSIIPEEQKICILYENILKLKNKFELLDLLNFTDWNRYLNPVDYETKIPKKQATGDQLEYFINKDEILNWYYSSPFAIVSY